MKFSRVGFLSCVAVAVIAVIGCGGGGGGTGSGGGNGGGGGGSSTLTIAIDLQGLKGSVVNRANASQTPQTIQVKVKGVVKTITNVIVLSDVLPGQDLYVLNQGSRPLNGTVNNPASGAQLGASGMTVPINASGVLQASVASQTSIPVILPAGKWQGISLPQGSVVNFAPSIEGLVHIVINGAVKFSPKPGDLTGSIPVSYTSPLGLNLSGGFYAANNSSITFSGTGLPGSRKVDAAWKSHSEANGLPVFDQVQIVTGL